MVSVSKELLPPKVLHRTYPVNLLDDDRELFIPTTVQARRVVSKTLSHVSVNSELCLKKIGSVSILPESFADDWQFQVYNSLIFRTKNSVKDFFRGTDTYANGLWILDPFSTGGYYHWLTEILPRLFLSSSAGIDLSVPLFLPAYFFEKWHFISDLIHPFRRPVITFASTTRLLFDNLAWISPPGGPLTFQPNAIMPTVKVLLDYYSADESDQSHYIYVTRTSASPTSGRRRFIVNELEVQRLVASHGFSIVDLDSMSVAKQISLFRRCKMLVALHGAALTNMVFMPEGAKILEIRHCLSIHMHACFWHLACSLGHQYWYLASRLQTSPGSSQDVCFSIHVSIPDLDRLLCDMINR